MSVSKTQLIADVAAAQNMTKAAVAIVVDGLFTAIADYAVAGEKIRIDGFGSFVQKHKAARTARNPQTGLPVEVPARSELTFKAAKTKA